MTDHRNDIIPEIAEVDKVATLLGYRSDEEFNEEVRRLVGLAPKARLPCIFPCFQ